MKKSKSETERQQGKHQVDEQRSKILDTAQKLFLQKGLEATSMIDIARENEITKVTLYRYFPNRDVIALEIHKRMIEKIISLVDLNDQDVTLAGARRLVKSMIDNFAALRDAYRYMGIFDSIYLDQSGGATLPQWTKEQLSTSQWIGSLVFRQEAISENPQGERFILVLSTVIWFLEKLALRGELTWSDQAIPLQEHLKLFEEMILGYIDQFMSEE